MLPLKPRETQPHKRCLRCVLAGLVLLCSAMLAPAGRAAPARPAAAKPAAARPPGARTQASAVATHGRTAQAAYLARVGTIHTDLEFELSRLLTAWHSMESARAGHGGWRRPAAGEAPAASAAQTAAARAALVRAIGKVRANARRLRGISPVPRFLKRADDRLITSSLELDSAMDALTAWLAESAQPSQEWDQQASKQLRKATTTLAAALEELARRTDPAITGKVYVGD